MVSEQEDEDEENLTSVGKPVLAGMITKTWIF